MRSNLAAFVSRRRIQRALNASTEVISKIGGQPLSDSFGRQQLKKYTRVIFDYAKRNPGLIKQDLGSMNGLNMKLIADTLDRVVTIDDGTKVVAYGALENSHWSNRKTLYNLYVSKDYRGQGLASAIHAGAAHVYKHLESDSTMAMGALKAFKSLEKLGYKVKMLDTSTGETVPFTWGPKDIPIVGGASIEDEHRYVLYV